MSTLVLPATHGRYTIRVHAGPSRIPPFIAWLRQVRRSAWILIGLCSLFPIGDALVAPAQNADGTSAAIAGDVQ